MSAVVLIPRESIESVASTITADTDPTALLVRFAFTTGVDRPSTWTAGSWQGAATLLSSGRYRATALSPLIGQGTLDLAPGTYAVWVQLDGATEDPVVSAGTLRIT